LRGVVFEVDADEGAVAEGVDFLEAVGAVGSTFADDGVAAVEVVWAGGSAR
jgi:hypothetical protein